MKTNRIKKGLLVTTMLVMGTVLLTPVTAAAQSGRINMYRLYNQNSGEHFYTGDTNEKNSLVQAGWTYEGIGWASPSESAAPVYRLYNSNAGDHHYTMSAEERDHLVSVGWNDEGIGWYSDEAGTVPVYREYNPNAVTGTHNYTTSQAEDAMLVSVGWNAEGTGWYALGGETISTEEDNSNVNFPYALYSPVYNGDGTAYFYSHADISPAGGHSKEWREAYKTANSMIDADKSNTVKGYHTCKAESLGVYAEGEIKKFNVYIQPINPD